MKKNNYFKKAFVFVVLVTSPTLLFSQKRYSDVTIDTINLKTNDLEMEYLKPGRKLYLTYIERTNGELYHISIWQRDIKFSKLGGVPVVMINQLWRNVDSLQVRKVFSISKKSNFEPIYHHTERGGKIEAYDFTSKSIEGSDSIANNQKHDFNLDLQEPTLNWELDMEVFQTLPYAANTIFRINFYHPGSTNGPEYYDYSVIGDDLLKISKGILIDCWMLKIQYGENSSGTFWIDKNTHEVLRLQEKYDGFIRYKVRFDLV